MTGYLYHGDPWLEEANARIMAMRKASDPGGNPGREKPRGRSVEEAQRARHTREREEKLTR